MKTIAFIHISEEEVRSGETINSWGKEEKHPMAAV